jgi:DNA-binding CsgD family transcriptional regulator
MEKYPLMDLVNLIYDRGFEHKDWNTVLESLCSLIQTRSAGLFFIDFKNQTYRVLGEYGFPSDFSPAYQQQLGVQDATATVMKMLPEGTALGAIDYKIAKTKYPDFYQNLLLPNDVGFISALNICNNEEYFVGLGIHRRMNESQLNDDELEVLKLLYPHFKRVFNFSDILEKLQEKEKTLSSALEKIPLGLITVDSELKVHFANDVAKLIASQKLGVAIQNDQLHIENHSDRNKIKSAVTKILAGDTNASVVRVTNKYEKEPLSITITDAQRTNTDLFLTTTLSNIALIYLSHSELCSYISPKTLQEVYKLTHSEAQLALSLTHGLTLQSYADFKGVSIQTVRSQLKVVFNKTQVKSQTELVRTLVTSSINLVS